MRHAILVVALVGCGPRPDGSNVDAGSTTNPTDAVAPPSDSGACGELVAVLRDFRADHPDFEHATGAEQGLVKTDLGADGKPVFALPGASHTISGAASFDQWYRDTPGINMHFEQPLPLTENPPGTYTFDDQDFFPLDGMGWPNTEIYGHNFLFTTEVHGTFQYRGGEQFEFDGDDDVWVFVNNKLALDLGGVHIAESATIDFDARASELGITVGGVYSLAVFHAERHTDQSHFRLTTTISCPVIQ